MYICIHINICMATETDMYIQTQTQTHMCMYVNIRKYIYVKHTCPHKNTSRPTKIAIA